MPKSRGRPPGRGRSRQQRRRPAAGRGAAAGFTRTPEWQSTFQAEEKTDCWFDDPEPGNRLSWAVPPAHGTCQGLDLELLNPHDEHELGLLMEAWHPEFADALERGTEVIVKGEPVNPRLHIVMHQVVANQLLADDPPETWQTVQRLAGLGYDWHNVMHMISGLVSEDIHRAMTKNQPFDRAGYVRRLNELPGDWPPPEEPGLE